MVKEKELKQTLLTDFEAWWAIRITVDDLDLNKTFKLFEQEEKFIISEEGDGLNTRLHQHILLVSDKTRDQITDMIRKVYPNAKGNKCIYIKPSRDNTSLAKYTVKEGNYKYKGFTEKYIQDTFKCARAKTDLKKDITALEDLYILHTIEAETFLQRYIQLKVKHDQNLYTSHIKAYMHKMMIRAGDLEVEAYSGHIIAAIKFEN